MISFKYSKTDGAEYLSHLDLLRHVYRTMRRAEIDIKKSEGYHAHAKIFLNNPLPLGIKSVAEFGAVDTDFEGDFAEAFNAVSPRGVKCLDYKLTDKNPNYANSITRCEYLARGLNKFDPREILKRESIVITDTRGREIDIRPRIYALEYDGGDLKFIAGCGADNLRPDLFCAYLADLFGGKAREIIKLASYGEGVF